VSGSDIPNSRFMALFPTGTLVQTFGARNITVALHARGQWTTVAGDAFCEASFRGHVARTTCDAGQREQ
jgi:hypothetical protein